MNFFIFVIIAEWDTLNVENRVLGVIACPRSWVAWVFTSCETICSYLSNFFDAPKLKNHTLSTTLVFVVVEFALLLITNIPPTILMVKVGWVVSELLTIGNITLFLAKVRINMMSLATTLAFCFYFDNLS